jgi:hypothetical protein
MLIVWNRNTFSQWALIELNTLVLEDINMKFVPDGRKFEIDEYKIEET